MGKNVLYLVVLLFLMTSCCKDEDERVHQITATWDVGIFNDADHGTKHLTFEIYPNNGYVEALDLKTYWCFYNGKQSKTITLTDSDFNLSHINTNGIYAISWNPFNYILDDYSWVIKEVYIEGQVKVSGSWYSINVKRLF